jgi:integration host factor subunit beta
MFFLRFGAIIPYRNPTMNKLELIETLKNNAGISKKEASTAVKLFSDRMADTLVKGDRVEIRGLCSFFVKSYNGYTWRNPKTGGKVQVSPKRLPFFKAGKELKEMVDN